jgi:hypothetical protein
MAEGDHMGDKPRLDGGGDHPVAPIGPTIDVPQKTSAANWRAILACFGSGLATWVSVAFSNYLQARGFVSMEIALVFLVICWLGGMALIVIAVMAFVKERRAMTSLLGCLVLTVALFSLEAIARRPAPAPKPSPEIERGLRAITINAYNAPSSNYDAGTTFCGITWREEYVDTRIDLTNANAEFDLDNIVIRVAYEYGIDIGAVGQLSAMPDVSFSPDGVSGALTGLDSRGRPLDTPFQSRNGHSMVPSYHVFVKHLPSRASIGMCLGVVATNTPVTPDGKTHPLFAPKHKPHGVGMEGTYDIAFQDGTRQRYNIGPLGCDLSSTPSRCGAIATPKALKTQ